MASKEFVKGTAYSHQPVTESHWSMSQNTFPGSVLELFLYFFCVVCAYIVSIVIPGF